MLSKLQIEQFNRDGFLNGGRILDQAALEELGDDLQRILNIGPDGFQPGDKRPVIFRDLNAGGYEKDNGITRTSQTPVWQIINIWEASEVFRRLLYNPFIVKAVSLLTDHPDLMVWHDQIQYKPPKHGGATHWHQDAPAWPTISPLTPVSAWIPMDDADEENGCMWMVPGSHRWGPQSEFLRTKRDLNGLQEFRELDGFRPPKGTPIQTITARPWPVKAGEVSFHHSVTWHGSPMNASSRPRRAIAIHYMTGEARFNAKGDHLMKKFIHLKDGESMANAGKHFPAVCRNGKPLDFCFGGCGSE